MKNDLFKKLSDTAEIEYLQQHELQDTVGGIGSGTVVIKNPITCGGSQNSLVWCPGDVCDPFNLGACAGNTVMGGPGTCPLTE